VGPVLTQLLIEFWPSESPVHNQKLGYAAFSCSSHTGLKNFATGPFLARTLALLDEGWLAGAVLLQRADSGGTDGRADIFNRAVAEVTCCWRPRWIPGTTGNGPWWFAWFVWLPDRSGPPVPTASGALPCRRSQRHRKHRAALSR